MPVDELTHLDSSYWREYMEEIETVVKEKKHKILYYRISLIVFASSMIFILSYLILELKNQDSQLKNQRMEFMMKINLEQVDRQSEVRLAQLSIDSSRIEAALSIQNLTDSLGFIKKL